MNRTELKTAAKSQIKGKIGILFVITLIIGLISGIAGFILSFIPGGGLVASIIITPAFALSIIRVYLDVVKGNHPQVGDAFCGFEDFWSAFKLTLIPGIVKSISYSMSMYILAENKGKPALECINESKAMTNGHKMDLFVLSLSFIGWGLLCAITFGIAGIWVVPYVQATYTNAYNSLKPIVVEDEQPNIIAE